MAVGGVGIEAHGLGKSFGGVRVLDGVDLRVGAGEVVALLGRNGAGKSTTVRILSTLTRPDEGGVRIAGIDALADEIEDMPEDGPTGNSALTAAELRLLPLLSTHLSFREIGERLFVSRNTIKTQAISVYRKLGVSSRSEAIARASELGLVGAEKQALAVRPLDATNSAASA